MLNIIDMLAEHDAYNIVGHVRPDGDCIGSEVALCLAFNSLGKRCFAVRNDSISKNFEYFFHDVPCVDLKSVDASLPLICVDCSDYGRIGNVMRSKCPSCFLSIDHHLSNDFFAQKNIVDAHTVSTTEIILKLFIEANIEISQKIAEALYLGIMTDSGRFAYANTSATTFRYAELLIEAGVNVNKIYSIVYENNTLQRYKLLERLLKNIELFCHDRACLSFVSDSDFIEIGASAFETEGFVNYTRELSGVLIGCFLEFHKNRVKCSLRCVDKSLRVDLLATKFGGGGHPCAAGFLKIGNISDSFVEQFKSIAHEHLENFYNDYKESCRQ